MFLYAGELVQEEAEGGAIVVTEARVRKPTWGSGATSRSVLDFRRSKFGTSELKRMQLAKTTSVNGPRISSPRGVFVQLLALHDRDTTLSIEG